MLKRDSVKRDQNFEGMWVLPGFSKEKANRGPIVGTHAVVPMLR